MSDENDDLMPLVNNPVLKLNWGDVFNRMNVVREKIAQHARLGKKYVVVWGLPRGGAIVAGMLAAAWPKEIQIVGAENMDLADVVIDDVNDTGATLLGLRKLFPYKPIYHLVDKIEEKLMDKWVRFPWEKPEEDGERG